MIFCTVFGKFLLLCLPLVAHPSTFFSFRKFPLGRYCGTCAFYISHIVNHSFLFFFHRNDQVHISGDLLLAIIQTLIQVCGERYVGDVMGASAPLYL